MTQCPALGALTVGGKEVAAFRCSMPEGHAENRRYMASLGVMPDVTSPHRYTLEWADDESLMLPDEHLFDPDERFDNVVPFERPILPATPPSFILPLPES